MRKGALYLRIVHGIITLYFTLGLFYMYYVGLTGNANGVLFGILTITMAIEVSLVFLVNNGDCPLIHVQRRLGDEVPFFELIFPKRIAKYAIELYAGLGLIGVVIVLFRFVVCAH
jgi:hypothetical protein